MERARFEDIYRDRALMNGGYQVGGYYIGGARRRKPRMRGGAKKSKGKRHCIEYGVSEKGNARCMKYAKGPGASAAGRRKCIRYKKGPTGQRRCHKYMFLRPGQQRYCVKRFTGPSGYRKCKKYAIVGSGFYYPQNPMMKPGYGGGPNGRRAAASNCWIMAVRKVRAANPGMSWKQALQFTSAAYRQNWPRGSSTYKCILDANGNIVPGPERYSFPRKQAYWLGPIQVRAPKGKRQSLAIANVPVPQAPAVLGVPPSTLLTNPRMGSQVVGPQVVGPQGQPLGYAAIPNLPPSSLI